MKRNSVNAGEGKASKGSSAGGKPGEEYVRVCPRCGSTNIDRKIETSGWVVALGGMGSAAVFDVFNCIDCGYFGQFMPEFPKSKLDKLRTYKTKDSNRG